MDMVFVFYYLDVKGPKKILPSLPFGNMGKDTVESRKDLLEGFLAVSYI